MSLERIAKLFVFGSQPAGELPSLAMQAMVDGFDSPSLLKLACAEGADPYELRSLFLRSLEELGIALPSESDSSRFVALETAEAVLAGTLSPREGAWRFREIESPRWDWNDRLGRLKFLASLDEEDYEAPEDYPADILEECRLFLAGMT